MSQRTPQIDLSMNPVIDLNSPPAHTHRAWLTTANGKIDSETGDLTQDYIHNTITVACYLKDASGQHVAGRMICMHCDETYEQLQYWLKTTLGLPQDKEVRMTVYMASVTNPNEFHSYELSVGGNPQGYLRQIHGRGSHYCRITVRPQ